MNEKQLNLLKDDNEYYNGEGRMYLSNSNIDMMMRTPKLYLDFIQGNYTPEFQTNYVIGNAAHVAILQGLEKLDSEFAVLPVATRNNKEFRECTWDKEKVLLEKEYELIHSMYDRMYELSKTNIYIADMMNPFEGDTEAPMIKDFNGVTWKMKADKVTANAVIDLKTTSDISKFKYSARNYGYNSQAYLYSQAFEKPMFFIVIDKKTLEVGIFDCSEEFLGYGANKVKDASDFYLEYIDPCIKTGDTTAIDNHISLGTL